MLKRIIKDSAVYGLIPYIAQFAGFLSLPFITPFLTATDYGIWGLIVAYSSALSAFQLLGLNVVFANTLIKHPATYSIVWRQLYGFLTYWSLLYSFIVAAILYFLLPIQNQFTLVCVSLITPLPVLLFGPTSIVGNLLHQLKQKPYPVAVRSVIQGLLTIGLNVVFIRFYKLGFLGWVYSSAIASCLVTSSWYPTLYKQKLLPHLKIKASFVLSRLKVSMPFIPHFYSSFLLETSDRFLMGTLGIPTADIGKYNVAYTFGNLVNGLVGSSGYVVGPMMARAYKNGEELLAKRIVFLLMIAVVTGCFITSIWLKEILALLFRNKELNSVYPLAVFVVMSFCYRPMYYGTANKLFYLEKGTLILRLSFVAGIINVLLNLALLPIVGYKVAVYTTFVSYLYMGFSGYVSKSIKSYLKENYQSSFWFIIILFLTIVAYTLRDIPLFYKIAVSCFAIVASGLQLYRLNEKLNIAI